MADEVLGRQVAGAWHSYIQVTLRVVCCLPKHLKRNTGKQWRQIQLTYDISILCLLCHQRIIVTHY